MKEMTWASFLSCVACVLIVAYAAFGIPYIEYCKAVSLQKDGKIIEAYDAYIALGDYKDSKEKAASLYEQYKAEKFRNAAVGDFIFLGTYDQDNDALNGKEDIQWLVLAIEDGKALVTSRYGLACMQYHTRDEKVTWENCTLRAWLNEVFWESVFSAEEQEKILTTTVPVDKKSVNTEDQGDPTEDKLFILSALELETYLKIPEDRTCRATKSAVFDGADVSDTTGCGWYWTRTSGRYSDEVLTVDSNGNIGTFGDDVAETYSLVRPAMWVDLKERDH